MAREENDRDLSSLLPFPDKLRGLVAVYAGHLNVEENHGKRLLQQAFECFFARGRPDQPAVRPFQDRLQGQQALETVIHQKDIFK